MTIMAIIRRNRLFDLQRQLGSRSKQNVDDAAADIRDRASQLAPRDTGSLAASIYVATDSNSDYAQHAGAAHGLNPDAVIVPEVTPQFVLSLFGGAGGYTSVVGVAVEHGTFQELGTRFQAPQPFLLPAVEAVRDPFISAMTRVADV